MPVSLSMLASPPSLKSHPLICTFKFVLSLIMFRWRGAKRVLMCACSTAHVSLPTRSVCLLLLKAGSSSVRRHNTLHSPSAAVCRPWRTRLARGIRLQVRPPLQPPPPQFPIQLKHASRSPNVGVASCHATSVEPLSSGHLAVQAGASALLHVAGADGHVHVR